MKRICLNQSVLDFMDARIDRNSFVLEFGAGWSSPWFADRCGKLLSVESDRKWANTVSAELANSDCHWHVYHFETIANVATMLSPFHDVDLVLVDSREDLRKLFATLGWSVLKPGGWLIFDDAQRMQHRESVLWLGKIAGVAKRLEWQQGDIESAVDRLALAWQKPNEWEQK